MFLFWSSFWTVLNLELKGLENSVPWLDSWPDSRCFVVGDFFASLHSELGWESMRRACILVCGYGDVL